jgi:hypothetical protein
MLVALCLGDASAAGFHCYKLKQIGAAPLWLPLLDI